MPLSEFAHRIFRHHRHGTYEKVDQFIRKVLLTLASRENGRIEDLVTWCDHLYIDYLRSKEHGARYPTWDHQKFVDEMARNNMSITEERPLMAVDSAKAVDNDVYYLLTS
jgi:hypothetical protein